MSLVNILHEYYAKAVEAVRGTQPLMIAPPPPPRQPEATREDYQAYVSDYECRLKTFVTDKSIPYRQRRSNAEYMRLRLKIAESSKEV